MVRARWLSRFARATALSAGACMVVLLLAAAPGYASINASVAKVGPQNGGGEPSIAFGPEGNAYVSYPASPGPLFYRSFNGGLTWGPGQTVATSSGDTTVNVDRTGAVYESNLNSNLQIDLYKSLDAGKTFPQKGTSLDTMDSTSQPFLVDRQWTDAYVPPGSNTGHGRVYIQYHDFAPSQVWVASSTDGGKTFGTPVDVLAGSPQAEAASFCNSIPGGLKVVKSGPHAGRIYVAWLGADLATNVATGCNLTQLNTFHSVWVASSDDGGATWTSHLVFDGGIGHDASALFADLTLDNQGNPYVAFGDNLDNEWDMWVQASFDGGVSWNGSTGGTGAPYKVNADTGTHFFPAITAGDPGKVDVSYLGTPTKISTLPYGKPAPGGGAGASWYVYAAQSLNLLSGHPTWAVTRVTPQPMHVGDVCTLGLFCTVFPSANRNLLDFIDAALDKAGRTHISFTQDTTPQNSGIYVANQTGGTTVGHP
ncbi:MAG: hypothetical protein ACRDNK_04970 [Solirubrobacteraceae bacterium]